MKATVEHEFEGCYYGCPYCSDNGTMSPEYCRHPSFIRERRLVGFSQRTNEIPEGKLYPDWCPVVNAEAKS